MVGRANAVVIVVTIAVVVSKEEGSAGIHFLAGMGSKFVVERLCAKFDLSPLLCFIVSVSLFFVLSIRSLKTFFPYLFHMRGKEREQDLNRSWRYN